MNRSVRVLHNPGRIGEHTEQIGAEHLETGFLPDLSTKRVENRLILLDPATDKSPRPIIGSPIDEDRAVELDQSQHTEEARPVRCRSGSIAVVARHPWSIAGTVDGPPKRPVMGETANGGMPRPHS